MTKDHTASVRVTKAEKDDIKLVAAFDQTTEDELIRSMTVADVVARAASIRALRSAEGGA